jgi:hypothetical protein
LAQDQALGTNYFKRKVLKVKTESKCPLCTEYEETIDHLTTGCPILAKNEYIIRHNKVCTHLHYSVCKEFGIEVPDSWYSHVPKPVCEHEDTPCSKSIRLYFFPEKPVTAGWQI